MGGVVTAVSYSAGHTLVKQNRNSIRLLAGLGVEGDAHLGATVKHRSRLARFSKEPNLRQVHLIHAELHDELRERGFAVSAGQMGENVTTRGIDLLGLPARARLCLGDTAVIEVTGLRNPCAQLDRIQRGLMAATPGTRSDWRPCPQGRYHGYGVDRRRRAARRPDQRRATGGAIPVADTGLGTDIAAPSRAAPGRMLRRLLKRKMAAPSR
jgi:hypothetical protein